MSCWWSSQRAVVGASHGEQPLQGVGGVRVLHGALGLQVGDERRHGLQQVLLGKLPADKDTSLSDTLSVDTLKGNSGRQKAVPDFWRSWRTWWRLPSALGTRWLWRQTVFDVRMDQREDFLPLKGVKIELFYSPLGDFKSDRMWLTKKSFRFTSSLACVIPCCWEDWHKLG